MSLLQLINEYKMTIDKDGTISILDGLARFSPEAIEDIERIWGIPPEELFGFMVKAKNYLYYKKGEIDFRLKELPTRHHDKAIGRFTIFVISSGQEIYENYFIRDNP